MSASDSPQRPPVAVVGVSALFPGSTEAEGFWSDILAGKDLLTDVPPSHWLVEDYYDADPSAPDKTYARRGGFLPDVDFDALGWGIPPSIIPATDTSQLLGLIVAQQVLEDASRGQVETLDRSRISVILGVTSAQELLSGLISRLQRPVWVKALRESGLPESQVEEVCQRISDSYQPWQESSFPGLLGNVVAGRIANRLDLGGTNCVTDAACASTFAALSMALNELYLYDSDMVIAGGVDTLNDIFMFTCFSKTPALSPTGDCRPFSDQADGTMLGEGLGMVAIKRLADAERDGDPIYAVIRSVGSSSDGRSSSVYAPVSAGQTQAIRRAYRHADFAPETVELIEAHGTATKAGDIAELGGLKAVFESNGKPWCALGSVKSQVGHCKAAAGAAGLFKSIMALHHKVLPPTLKVERPNPALEIEDSAFYLNTRSRPWIRSSAHPRRAGVSSFGFGGSNFHVALEEYGGEKRASKLRSFGHELVLLSGADAGAVADRADLVAARAASSRDLAWVAWSSQKEYDVGGETRLAIVACDVADLISKLEMASKVIRETAEPAFSPSTGTYFGTGTRAGGIGAPAGGIGAPAGGIGAPAGGIGAPAGGIGAPAGGIGFLFPGQGSQYPNMSADLAMAFDAAREPWDRAADLALDPEASLAEVVFPVPSFELDAEEMTERRLTATEWAQPAIVCSSLSMLAMLRRLGVEPDAVAGHSLGEITALHAGGALSSDDVLLVARRRGELMAQETGVAGAMSAISGCLEEVTATLAEISASAEVAHGVVVANHNGPSQVVLSGTTVAIEAIEKDLERRGLKTNRLPVATAFHSPLVAAVCPLLRQHLEKVNVEVPAVPVYCNASARPYDGSSDAIRDRVAAAVAEPVRFVEMVEAMATAGIGTFIEVGPGAVLSGLVERILGDRAQVVALDRKGRDGVRSLFEAVAKLAAAGVEMDLAVLWDEYRTPRDPDSKISPKLTIAINGSNYGKPYPPPGGAADLPAPNPEPEPLELGRMLHASPSESASAAEAQPSSSPQSPAPQSSASQSSASAQPEARPSGADLPAGWLEAWQEAQRQTAQAHTSFQQAMAGSHAAYLQAAQASLAGLAAASGHASPGDYDEAGRQPASRPSAALIQPLPFQVQQTVAEPLLVPMPAVSAQSHRPSVSTTLPESSPAHLDYQALMLEVVADKTGYPSEMLDVDMDLEADLGIDSIKRVEILAAFEEQAPGLPPIDAALLGTLQTLGEIIEHMESAAPGQASVVAESLPSELEVSSSVDYQALMLEVVADKTGYPCEMLDVDMDLEADLGIDSIKRVEILAAFEERAPDLPAIDPAQLGTLKTLGEIIQHTQSHLPRPQPPGRLNGLGSSRFILERAEAPALGFAMSGTQGAGPVAVTDDGGGVAQALVVWLAERGVAAEVCAEVSSAASAVIFLGGLREVRSQDEAIAINREAFRAARAVASTLSVGGGLFVTVQDSGGAFDPAADQPLSAWLGGLPALVKTAALEWPEASLRAIDLERGGRDAASLAVAIGEELLAGGAELEIGLSREGSRITLQSVASPVVRGAAVIESGDVVVVSGGGRGVTAASMIAWARECKARFVLLGRTGLVEEPACCAGVEDDAELKRALLEEAKQSGSLPSPAELGRQVRTTLANREILRTVAAIEEAGGAARYLAVDVTDTAALHSQLEMIRRDWGPVRALVHAAGVLADKQISELADEHFDLVFDTKVEGLRALLDATAADPLALLCFFSSVTARCGNRGQAAYAMANEVLNKVATVEAKRRPGTLVKAMGWGPWDGGMVDSRLKAHFEALGVPLIPIEAGAAMLADELHGADRDRVELVLGGEPRSLFAPDASPTLRLEQIINRSTHRYLADHAIGGTPVVPVVMAIEWLARMTQAFCPDLELASISDVKVIRGIRLEGFDNGGDRLTLTCRQAVEPLENGHQGDDDGTQLALEILGADGRPHYRARARMVKKRCSTNGLVVERLTGLEEWDGTVIYDGEVLFHGHEFQVIEKIEGISDAGASALIKGVERSGWSPEAWQTDVAAFDGGLQLAVLWARRMLGGASLPTAIAEVRTYNGGPPQGPIRCQVVGTTALRSRAVSDIIFLEEGGVPFAELRGVETHLRPDLA